MVYGKFIRLVLRLFLLLFYTSTAIKYLTNFANGYVLLAYYINLFFLAIGILTFFIRVAEKRENVYFLRWLLISLTIIFLQWLLFYFLGAQR